MSLMNIGRNETAGKPWAWILVLALAGSGPAVHGTGLTWPASQFLPTFSKPAATIDCISLDGIGNQQRALFTSLEGIVNRTQPQIACVISTSEGEFVWLNNHNLSHNLINGFTAIQKYKTNVTGLVVTDPNQPDTLNLATTIAGIKDELICDPSLLPTLTNSPYNLPVKDDLRGMFATKYQVYGYLYTNYWPQCTHRIIVGLQTNYYWGLRDYAIALKAAVVWLNPNVTDDANVLAPFVSQMTPVGGLYLGWVPSENADVSWLATYGIPVLPSDYFHNATVYGGVRMPINVPPIPPTPPLQNKVYVSMILSDGNNVQYMQHTMYPYWQTSARGTVPIGWSVQPLLADFDPGMLNYFWSTATTNDCLISAPTGAGYTYIDKWSNANMVAFTKACNPYQQKTGIRTIVVGHTVSSTTGNAFATNCPTLVGINDQQSGYYTKHYGTLPAIGFPSDGYYCKDATNVLHAITNAAASWNGSSPMFISVIARSWTVTPADLQSVANSLSPSKYVVVRPDQLFLLYQESAGLGQGGAVPYVATQPASQLTGVGSNVTFSAIASGSGPLSYQWLMNGTSIAGATNSVCVRSNVQRSDAGRYQAVITNPYGSVTSSVAVLTIGEQPLGFNGDGLNWTLNDNDNFFVYSTLGIANTLLTLTDGSASQARSLFFNSPQYIGAFQAAFTYQAGGNKGADGVTFCLHNDPRGASALGGEGGNLGVSGITPSIELELNIYPSNNQIVGYTVLTNGLTCAGGANGNYRAPGSINFKSGHPIGVTVHYADNQMTVTFTDAVTHDAFTTNLVVGDLRQLLGANTAYVGFTGADGAVTSIQTISDFSFTSIPSAFIQSNGDDILVSWSEGAPGYALQQNPDLSPINWVNVTNQSVLTNGTNQVAAPKSGSHLFYRLTLPSP